MAAAEPVIIRRLVAERNLVIRYLLRRIVTKTDANGRLKSIDFTTLSTRTDLPEYITCEESNKIVRYLYLHNGLQRVMPKRPNIVIRDTTGDTLVRKVCYGDNAEIAHVFQMAKFTFINSWVGRAMYGQLIDMYTKRISLDGEQLAMAVINKVNGNHHLWKDIKRIIRFAKKPKSYSFLYRQLNGG